MIEANVDFRYEAGFPSLADALRFGVRLVRCTSLEAMEESAGLYLEHGIQVWAVYTGESDREHYVMRNCSALQIGNEPWFAMQGDASWPLGTPDDFVNVWSHVARVLAPAVHPNGLPLIGPGIWCQDWAKWALIAKRLPGLSAAACHVYPNGRALSTVKSDLSKFRGVRPDLPLECSEWTERQPLVHATATAIDAYCAHKAWFAWGPGVPGHELIGTAELGILALR